MTLQKQIRFMEDMLEQRQASYPTPGQDGTDDAGESRHRDRQREGGNRYAQGRVETRAGDRECTGADREPAARSGGERSNWLVRMTDGCASCAKG